MKVVGITGGIATGKSTVSNYLKDKGYLVINADSLVHQAYQDPIIMNEIKESFNLTSLDRKQISELIFKDESLKKKLESILHPYVFNQTQSIIEENQNQSFIFLDVPLLFESGMDEMCDFTVTVYTSKDIQLDRLMKRQPIDQTHALVIMNAQMPIEEKKMRSDFVIDNEGSFEQTYRAMDDILKQMSER